MDETCRCKVAIKIAIELVPCTESEFEPNPRKSSFGNPKAGSYVSDKYKYKQHTLKQ